MVGHDGGTAGGAALFLSYGEGGEVGTGHWAARITARAHELLVRVGAGTDKLVGEGSEALPTCIPSWPCWWTARPDAATSDHQCYLGDRGRAGGCSRTAAYWPGMAADLVVLERDPTGDIHNTRAIVWVMKDGRRYERPHN